MTEFKFFTFIRKYSFFYIVSAIAITLSIILNLLFPQITRHIVDDVIIGKNMAALKPLLICLGLFGVGRCVFQYIKEFFCDYAGSKIGSEVRIALFEKIQSLSANFFDKINSGELMSRVKDDVDRIGDIFTYIGILLLEVALHTSIALYFMFNLNWKLSIIPMVGMLIAAFVAILMEKKLGGVYEEIAEENSLMNNTAAENLSGVRTVKAFCREKFEIEKFKTRNHHYYELNIAQSKVFVKYNPLLQTVSRLLPVCVLITGGFVAIKGEITLGELTAFIQYSMDIVWPMEMLGWLTNGLSAAIASKKRINKIFAKETEIIDGKENLETVKGDIVFENVCYKGENNKDILHDVSFHLQSGKTLGIMGATGSGKTTIINLLKRMYNVTSGKIFLDGKDITKIKLQTLRKNIACVMQDIFLFSDTIDGNVKLGNRDTLSDEIVSKALKDSLSSDFVFSMKDKTQTVIGERGIGLSGGQKQRLTIARALSRKTSVLVFDDSTSALDTETEMVIQQNLEKISGVTKIIIAHRISAVKDADEILVLENGKIAERGTHGELLLQKGLYYNTYKSQY